MCEEEAGVFRGKKRVRWEIIKKIERKYYFNKNVCIIDKLMWVFCKSKCKIEKVGFFCVKKTESFAPIDVIALRFYFYHF